MRGTFLDLQALEAEVVVIGSLLMLGPAIGAFGRQRGVAVEALQDLPHNHGFLPNVPCASEA